MEPKYLTEIKYEWVGRDIGLKEVLRQSSPNISLTG